MSIVLTPTNWRNGKLNDPPTSYLDKDSYPLSAASLVPLAKLVNLEELLILNKAHLFLNEKLAAAFCILAVPPKNKPADAKKRKQAKNSVNSKPQAQAQAQVQAIFPKLRKLHVTLDAVDRFKRPGKWDQQFEKIPNFPENGWQLLAPNLRDVGRMDWPTEFQRSVTAIAHNLVKCHFTQYVTYTCLIISLIKLH